MAEYILDKVIHYGAFKESLDKMVDVMRSECAGSVIVRGNPGSGKRTLIEEAEKIAKIKCVYVSSHFYNDDYSALKAIATELGFNARAAHISDIMGEIKKSAIKKEKLVIVLLDFEELCRKRQSLLYNLMNLIHTDSHQTDKGPNLTLVGLTVCLDWAENIEKRVRSRLNAKCINLTSPYTNVKEFLEFTSLMLDGYKIDSDLKEHLEYIYLLLPNPSIRTLKKFLNNLVDLDAKGKLEVNFDPNDWNDNYQINPNNLLRERLRYLTRNQLDQLKFALHYCFLHSKTGFTLRDLHELAKNSKSFDLTSTLRLCDTALLLRLKLIQPAKHDQPIDLESMFYPACTTKQLRAVVSGAPDLHRSVTDQFWKSLR